VHLTRCRLDPQYSCSKLLLREIDQGEGLVEFLRASFAKILVVDYCPGFGDAVLNAMTGPEPQKMRSCAHYIQGLSIINCPDFSISALKQLVETDASSPPGAIVTTFPQHHKSEFYDFLVACLLFRRRI
jgi:hypothetical protein